MSKRVGNLAGTIARILCAIGILSAAFAWASVGGSISGTVKDPAGRVLPNTDVTIKEASTGLSYQTHTDNKGGYVFPVLPVGHYELNIQAPGFAGYQRTGIVLDTNATLSLDASLEVGGVAQTVSVVDNTLHVDTTSTQLGQVITGRQMTGFPSMAAATPICSPCNQESLPRHRLPRPPCRTLAQPSSTHQER